MDCLVILMFFLGPPLKISPQRLCQRSLKIDLHVLISVSHVQCVLSGKELDSSPFRRPLQLPPLLISSSAAQGMKPPGGESEESTFDIWKIFLALSSLPFALTLCYSRGLMSHNDAWYLPNDAWALLWRSLEKRSRYLFNLMYFLLKHDSGAGTSYRYRSVKRVKWTEETEG